MRRALLGLLGLGLLAAAFAVHDERLDVPPPWPVDWVAAHPDPRDLGAEGEAAHVVERTATWRWDLSLLALGLGVACLAALWPRERDADADDGVEADVDDGPAPPLLGPLAVGAVALACVSLVGAVQEARLRAGRGAWTLGDDALRAVAGPHTDALRAWRDEVPEDASVLVVGTRDFLLNLVAWSLHPRAVHPVVVPVPVDLDAASLRELARLSEAGAGAPGGRWLVDLEALAGAAARPPLVQVDAP